MGRRRQEVGIRTSGGGSPGATTIDHESVDLSGDPLEPVPEQLRCGVVATGGDDLEGEADLAIGSR